MPEFFFDYSIGGTATIKVEAPNEDRAIEIVQDYAIDDFENAGPLRASDVHIERRSSDTIFDASVREEAGAWGYAPDDPIGRYDPDLYDEEVAR